MVLIVLRKKAYSQKWKLHINRFCWWVYAVKIYLCTLEFAHFFSHSNACRYNYKYYTLVYTSVLIYCQHHLHLLKISHHQSSFPM